MSACICSGGAVIDRTRYIELKTQPRDELGAAHPRRDRRAQRDGRAGEGPRNGTGRLPHALYRGEEVYLCWKLGEGAIEFWHGDEGFKGRKPIDRDFLDNHQGERTQ